VTEPRFSAAKATADQSIEIDGKTFRATAAQPGWYHFPSMTRCTRDDLGGCLVCEVDSAEAAGTVTVIEFDADDAVSDQ